MPTSNHSPPIYFSPGDDHGGMGPFLRPLPLVTPSEVGCVVTAGVRQMFGMSPYVSTRAPKPRLVTQFSHGTVRALMRMRDPEVILFENILSESECKHLINRARASVARSVVVDHDTGDGVQHPIRTSSGTSFKRGETSTIRKIEERISDIFQWPTRQTEPLSLLRYRPGEFYNEHHDFFDYSTKGSDVHRKNGGNRVATLILYLNDCNDGGETLFADVGLEALPRRGYGVYFSYANPHFSSMTRHAGRPPSKGRKWIATVWFKEGVFSSRTDSPSGQLND